MLYCETVIKKMICGILRAALSFEHTNLFQHIHQLWPCQKTMTISVGMLNWSSTGLQSWLLYLMLS